MTRRVGLARTAIPVAVLAIGTALTVVGLHLADKICYVSGLVVLAIGLALVALRLRAALRLPAVGAVVVALVVAAAVVTTGVEVPRHVLARELAGSDVVWKVENPLLRVPVGAPLQLGQAAVVLPGSDGWVMLSLKDGRVLQRFDASSGSRPIVAAPDRLLMIPSRKNVPAAVVLYDATGKTLWRHQGSSVLAYVGGVTVVQTCAKEFGDCHQVGYRDDGSQAWRRNSHSADPPGRRVATMQFLPARGTGDPGQVLPAIAVWPLTYPEDTNEALRWQFADPITGRVLRTVTAPEVGVVGTTMISETVDDQARTTTFTLAWPNATTPVVIHEPCGSGTAIPVAIGPLMLLTNTSLLTPTAIDTGEHVLPAARNVTLPSADDLMFGDKGPFLDVGVGVTGYATAGGDRVDGRSSASGQTWQHRTSTPTAQVSVGAQTVVVTNDLRRTTPFDDARGYQTGHRWYDVDQQVTVLQLGTGKTTAQLRTGRDDPVWAAGVGDGVALVADQHSVWLLGRQPS